VYVLPCGTRSGDAAPVDAEQKRYLFARRGEAQGALDQRALLNEPEIPEFYAHDAATCAQTVRPNRTGSLPHSGQRSLGYSRPPLFQPFEIEQRSNGRIRIGHPEQQIAKPVDQLAGRSVKTVKLQWSYFGVVASAR
jgi:hypothetical protein